MSIKALKFSFGEVRLVYTDIEPPLISSLDKERNAIFVDKSLPKEVVYREILKYALLIITHHYGTTRVFMEDVGANEISFFITYNELFKYTKADKQAFNDKAYAFKAVNIEPDDNASTVPAHVIPHVRQARPAIRFECERNNSERVIYIGDIRSEPNPKSKAERFVRQRQKIAERQRARRAAERKLKPPKPKPLPRKLRRNINAFLRWRERQSGTVSE